MESFTLCTIRGIPLRVHFTMLLAIPYFTLVIAAQFSALAVAAGIDPAQIAVPPLAWGLILSLGLFLSVALHEFGHSLLALRSGRQVHSVTLMILGGFSHIDQINDGEPGQQKREALISIMGPVVSLGLAVLFYLAMDLNTGEGQTSVALRFFCFYMGQINVMIGIFNLLPAFPLDGGRVLRALLAWRMGFDRGTQTAVTVGQFFAMAFMVFGVMTFNVILLLIAVFIFAAGAAEAQLIEVRRAVAGLTAADLMHQAARRLDAGVPVSQALRSVTDGEQVPVVCGSLSGQGGRIIGLIDAQGLRRIPEADRDAMSVGLAANHDVPTVTTKQPAGQVLELLASRGPLIAVVDDDGVFHGLIDQQDIQSRMKNAA